MSNKATSVDFERGATDAVWAELDALRASRDELLALLVEIDKRVIFDPASGFDREFNERVEAVLWGRS